MVTKQKWKIGIKEVHDQITNLLGYKYNGQDDLQSFSAVMWLCVIQDEQIIAGESRLKNQGLQKRWSRL